MIEESTIDRQRFGFGQTHIHQSPIDIIDNGFANPQQAGRRICDIPIYQHAPVLKWDRETCREVVRMGH